MTSSTTKFASSFKLAESFENLDNIFRGWAKDKVQNSLVKTLNTFAKEEEKKKRKQFRLEK